MSMFSMLLGNSTHAAEKYWPTHDGTLNVVEARRGRGKTYGTVMIAVEWLRERLPAFRAGTAEFSRVYTNIRFNRRRLALLLCLYGICTSHTEALEIVDTRIVYCDSWDEMLIAYDSLILMDEANRNLNVYDSAKGSQELMLTVHDWLQQTRKHKLTMYYLVQDLDWLKPQLISLCDRLWRAKRVRIKGTNKVKYFPWYGGDPFAKGKGEAVVRRADFKMKFIFDLKLAQVYDTLQAVRTWKQETRFKSFGELEDYMLAHKLKPIPSPTIKDALIHTEMIEWWKSVDLVRAGPLAHVAPSVPLPPLAGGGGAGGARCDLCRSLVVLASTAPVALDQLPHTFPG